MIQHSESLASLTPALIRVQAALAPVRKDAHNDFLQKKFISLSAVMEAIRVPLFDNGFAVTQLTDVTPDGYPVVVTTLLHESGEWLSSSLGYNPQLQIETLARDIVPALKDLAIHEATLGNKQPTMDGIEILKLLRAHLLAAQGVMGNISLFKRHALCAMFGIVADDENVPYTKPDSTRSKPERPRPKPRYREGYVAIDFSRPAQAGLPEGEDDEDEDDERTDTETAEDGQPPFFFELAELLNYYRGARGFTAEQIAEACGEGCTVNDLAGMSVEEIQEKAEALLNPK